LREQTVEGTIVDASSREPLRGMTVTLVADSAPMQVFAGEAFTDANGRFRILTAANGTYRLIAWGLGYAQRTQTVQLGESRGSQQFAFEMTKTAELRVRVIDAKSGVPLMASLTLQNTDGGFLPIRAESSGDPAYVFSLAAGKYRLTVSAEGYADRVVEVTAPGNIDVAM
jgi:5-hydroxyisourate hydrolase-like protein (transthyretin family)